MSAPSLETDYLVVGAGGAGLAFVDTLLDTSDADVVLVDRNDRPGGHWTAAYPFVRLHQPSAWYGVASRALDDATTDANDDRGATGAEVLAYFDRVLRERLLASGRVRWLPAHAYARDHARGADGAHVVTSRATGAATAVTVRRKLVDATHARTEVPSTHPPRYAVAPGVACVPPNRLPDLDRSYARYTVVGAGKTGMDTVHWLLARGVDPGRVRWIVPRDPWLQDRANMRPGVDHFARSMGSVVGQLAAMGEATSVPDLFARLEARGLLLRLDPSVEPTAYRCAIVSQSELAQLRRVTDVVRLGRVRALEPTRGVLERGAVPADGDTLYVDCSASALQPPPALPVFDGDVVNLLMVSWCQPLFSAALIACVEARVADEGEKRALCTPVPTPVRPADWLAMWATTLANAARWERHPEVSAWLRRCRLTTVSVLLGGARPDDSPPFAPLRDRRAHAAAAAANLPALLADARARGAAQEAT